MVDRKTEQEEPVVEGRNLLILPSYKVRQAACLLSRQLADRFDTEFVINDEDIIPHVTVYLTNYPVENLDEILDSVKGFYSGNESFVLKTDGYSNVSDFVFWDVNLTSHLYELHKRTVDLLKPLRDTSQKNAGLSNLTDEQKASFERYGSVLVRDQFLPHITLTRLRNLSDVVEAVAYLPKLEMDFKVESVCLTRVGPHGTCTEILEELKF